MFKRFPLPVVAFLLFVFTGQAGAVASVLALIAYLILVELSPYLLSLFRVSARSLMLAGCAYATVSFSMGVLCGVLTQMN